MRRDIRTPQIVHAVAGIVVFVRAQRHAMRATERCGPVDGSLPFGRACGLGYLRIDHQAMAILHQHMTKETQLCRCAGTLLVEQRLFVGLRLVGLAAEFLAPIIYPAVSTTPLGRVIFILR